MYPPLPSQVNDAQSEHERSSLVDTVYSGGSLISLNLLVQVFIPFLPLVSVLSVRYSSEVGTELSHLEYGITRSFAFFFVCPRCSTGREAQ